MADPVSLALVGSVALTEGIKFLYGQVSKILERRSARADAAKKDDAAAKKAEPENIKLPAVFEGQLAAAKIDFDEVERQYKALLLLRGKLLNHAEGLIAVDPKDKELLSDVDALRQVLESIYKQRITFRGEDREQSGTTITTKVKISEVAGKLVVTQIDEADNVNVDTQAELGNITDTGDVIITNIGKVKGK